MSRWLAAVLVALTVSTAHANLEFRETSVWNHGTEDEPPEALDSYLHRKFRNPLPEPLETRAWEQALVSANEGALWNLTTVTLVHQVVVTNARPWQDGELPDRVTERRIQFLRDHSGKVLGQKPCPVKGNCRWVRNLSKTNPTQLPAGIAAGNAGPKDWAAYWRIVMAPKWVRVLRFSRALVANDLVGPPCPIPPRTWGSLRKGLPDIRVAAGNSLYPIGCENTGWNDGFAPLERFPFWSMELAAVEW